MTTEYVVFSYNSGRFPHSLAIHRTWHALNSKISINNKQSLLIEHVVLLIITDQHHFSLSYNMSKGAEMGHVMLQ